jgi:hypothetical protein
MPEATSALLAAALVAVYLFDSAHFLSVGEAVVLTRRRRLCGLSFGGGFELAGRRPYLPNPLTPFRPVFRLDWDLSGSAVSAAREVSEHMRERLSALRTLGVLSALCGVSIVVLAPAGLLIGANSVFLAAALVTLVLAIAAGALLLLKKRTLGLTTWQAASMAFIATICLPCSANLARAVAAHHHWRLAASDLAELGFPSEDLRALRTRVGEALSSARRYVPEEGPYLGIIDAQLRKLGEHGS